MPCSQIEKSNTQTSAISLMSFYYGQTSDIVRLKKKKAFGHMNV